MANKQGGCYGGLFSLAFSAAAVLLCFMIQPTVAWPVVSVDDFSVANLGNKSAEDHTITYDIKFKNLNRRQGIRYETINLKFYYIHNSDKLYIGNATFSGFRVSYWNSVHRVGKFEPTRKELSNATAPEESFRVEIDATYRYEILFFFRSYKRDMTRGADLKLNYRGELENKKERLVSSGAIRNTLKSSPFKMGSMLLAVYFFLSTSM